VERAFASCTSDQERNEMETVLKRVISETMQDGSMWTKNWDTEALPRYEEPTHTHTLDSCSSVLTIIDGEPAQAWSGAAAKETRRGPQPKRC
jgi:hypothetical protein